MIFYDSGNVTWAVWSSGNDGDFLYYWSNQTNLNWTDAKAACQRNHWRLAVIKNEKENTFLTENLKNAIGARTSWIGLELKKGSKVESQTGNWTDGTYFNRTKG